MRSVLLFVLGMGFLLPPLFAQMESPSDDVRIDGILLSQQVSRGEAIWLVGNAAGKPDTPDPDSDPRRVTVAEFSQILLQTLALPRGVMYYFFPTPRYAYRELVFRRIIPSLGGPDAPVTGQAAFIYLQAALTWREAHQ